jgi:hypothetical protein
MLSLPKAFKKQALNFMEATDPMDNMYVIEIWNSRTGKYPRAVDIKRNEKGVEIENRTSTIENIQADKNYMTKDEAERVATELERLTDESRFTGGDLGWKDGWSWSIVSAESLGKQTKPCTCTCFGNIVKSLKQIFKCK